jgi:integrase
MIRLEIYLLLIIFTGLRRQEAAKLTWDQIDLKAKTLTVTDTKNHDTHTLPLTNYLHELLGGRKKIATSMFAFPAPSAGY